MGTHPGQHRDMGTHPGQLRDMGTHPGQHGDMAIHPGQHRDMGTHPGQHGDMAIHPGQLRDMATHPGQGMGRRQQLQRQVGLREARQGSGWWRAGGTWKARSPSAPIQHPLDLFSGTPLT